MPIDIQNTTLAGAPYFDDFSNAEANNYHRILFKPSVAVQARELTQLQTILQSQVERFGDNIYRRGTIIDGCTITYDAGYSYIKVLDQLVSGISVNVDEFANVLLQDSTGLQGVVVNQVAGLISQSPDLNTLYVKYTNVGTEPSVDGTVLDTKQFTANSIITAYNRDRRVERIEIVQGGVGYANTDTVIISPTDGSGAGAQAVLTTDSAGTIKTITLTSKGTAYTAAPSITVATTTGVGAVLNSYVDLGQLIIANNNYNSVGTGYAAHVTDGYIYQKGHFLKVEPQTLVVSKYATATDGQPNNVVVGFKTIESIATSLLDATLLDNATGSPNEMAPGADRLKLVPALTKYDSKVSAAADNNFLSLVEFEGGQVVKTNLNTTFNTVDTELSRRTYEESGDYVVKQFGIYAEEKMDPVAGTSNTLISNTTHLNLVVTPGLAYVNGLRTETIGNRRIPIRKSTDTEILNNVSISTGFGSFVYVNEIAGNFSALQNTTVTLYGGAGKLALSSSVGAIPSMPSASIGTAIIRGLEYFSGNPGSPNAVYKMYLYNVKMNAGKSFSDTYVIGISSTAIADVVRTSGKAVLEDVKKDGLVFPVGVSAAKSLTDTTLKYRASNSSVSFSTSGSATLAISTPGITFPYVSGTTLSLAEKQEFVIVPTTSTRSSDLTGNVNTTSACTTLTGTGTTFTTDLRVGDIIYVMSGGTGGTAYANRVTQINSDTQVVCQNTWPVSANTSSKYALGFPAYQPINVNRSTFNISVTSPSEIALSLGYTTNAAATQTLVIHNASVDKPSLRIKKIRKDVFVKISAAAVAANPNGPWCLGIPDVHKITAVYTGTSTSYATPSTATNDVTQFELVNGQTDNFYGLAYIRRAPNATLVTAGTSINLLVKMDVYYDHNSVSGGAFFAGAPSYPIDDVVREANTAAITTEEIEIFRSTRNGAEYDLRNSIDFRPVAANTANMAATDVVDATVDPSSTETLATTVNYMPSPSGDLQADVEYYLSRVDCISLVPTNLASTTGATLVVTEGTPSVNPGPARTPEKSMLLANVIVPPYPSLDPINAKQAKRTDLSVKSYIKGQQKRYTMRDIGDIEKRIDRLEYYSLLNRMESSAKDLAAGRTLNGFFTDSFENFDMTNVDDIEYNAFVDTVRGELRPRVYAEMLDLKIDTSAGAKNSGVNTAVQDQVLLDFTKVDFVEQPFASRVRNLAGEYWKFKGNISIFPKYDGQYDQDVAPVNVTIDIASAQKSIIDGINSAFSQMDGRVTVSDSTTTNWTLKDSASSDISGGGKLTTNTTISGTTTTVTGTKDRASLTTGSEATALEGQFNLVSNIDFRPFMRSAPIYFFVNGLRPGARHYVYFDDQDVNQYVMPGRVNATTSSITDVSIIPTGVLGAELRADQNGRVAGIFYIPASTFYVGTRVLKILDVGQIASEGAAISYASTEYNAYNIDISHQQVSISTKKLETISNEWREYYSGVLSTSQSVTGVDVSTTYVAPPPPPAQDPLAQTFLVPQELSKQTDGVFITDIDIYLQSKDITRGVTMQLRDVVNGYPGGAILPFGTKWIPPTSVYTSTDATAATRFTFDTPVFLNAGKEYAMVIIAEGGSPEFYTFTGEAGQADIANPNVIAKTDWGQGQLFTSVNNTAWNPHSFEDLKFKMQRAAFTPYATGTNTLAPNDYEFLTLVNTSGTFQRGEKVAQRASTYKVGDVITTSTSATISGVNTLYGADLKLGDDMLVVYGSNATSISLTGTASGTTTSTTLTGASSTFTSDFAVGDYIKVNNNIRQVVNIANNTQMTLDAPTSNTFSGAAMYKWNNINYDILRVQQIINDTTVVVDRVPKISTSSSVSAQYMKVVTAEVDRYRETEKKLFLKKSTASDSTFAFVKSTSANSGRLLIGGVSGGAANVASIDNLTVNYIEGAMRTISPTGTSVQIAYDVSQAGVTGYTTVPGVPMGSTPLSFEGVMNSKSRQIVDNATNTPSLRVVSTLQTASQFVSPAIDISPAQVQILRNNIDNYTSILQTANTTLGQPAITTTGAVLTVGMGVRGIGIPNDTTVTSISGNTVTLSKSAQFTKTNQQLEFHPNETTRYGISKNKYVSKYMVLTDGAEAEDFRLWLTAYRPIGTSVDVYARFISPDDNENVDNKEWTLLQLSDTTSSYSDPVKTSDYYEYYYTLPKTPPATLLTGKGQTNSNTTLTGLSTTFSTELKQYDVIKIVKGDTTTANGAPLYGTTDNYVIRTVTAITSNTELTLDASVPADTSLIIQKVTQPRAAFAYCNTTPQYLLTYHGADTSGNVTAQYRTYKYVAIKIVLKSNSTKTVPVVRDVRALSMMAA